MPLSAKLGILQTEPEGEVRISLPTGYSAVEPMKRTVQTLRSRYPKIRLILNENNRLVDLQNDTDIAIRVVSHPDDPDSIARPLAQWQTLICASPDYLHKHPIAQPQNLLNADWLNHNSNVLLHAFKCLGLPETLPENRTDCPDSSLGRTRICLCRHGNGGVAFWRCGAFDRKWSTKRCIT